MREYLLRWGNCTNSRPRICGTIILIKCKGIKACNVSKCHLKVCQSDDEQFYRYHKKYFYVHVVPHFLFKLSFKWLMNYCWLETYCLTWKTHLYGRFKWFSLILRSGLKFVILFVNNQKDIQEKKYGLKICNIVGRMHFSNKVYFIHDMIVGFLAFNSAYYKNHDW